MLKEEVSADLKFSVVVRWGMWIERDRVNWTCNRESRKLILQASGLSCNSQLLIIKTVSYLHKYMQVSIHFRWSDCMGIESTRNEIIMQHNLESLFQNAYIVLSWSIRWCWLPKSWELLDIYSYSSLVTWPCNSTMKRAVRVTSTTYLTFTPTECVYRCH